MTPNGMKMQVRVYSISFVAVIRGFLFGYDTTVISGVVESLIQCQLLVGTGEIDIAGVISVLKDSNKIHYSTYEVCRNTRVAAAERKVYNSYLEIVNKS